MILMLNPPLGRKEFAAAFDPIAKNAVGRFERAFSRAMGTRYALAFPYGRTALMALLEALDLGRQDVLCPAYTCAVVPHAVVYSGNVPVFVDCEPDGFNMDLDQAERLVTRKTGALIATSLFGYPVDMDRLERIRDAHPHVHLIMDCAQSVGASWRGRPIHKNGIAALFGLGIGKTLTSVFGGMITTDDSSLYRRLERVRRSRIRPSTWVKTLRRLVYLCTSFPALYTRLHDIVGRLSGWSALESMIREEDETVLHMPEDYLDAMCGLEARVGRANLTRCPRTIRNCRDAAEHYFSHVPVRNDLTLPPKRSGATYSHFVLRVRDRDLWVLRGLRAGIQLGTMYEYSLPELPDYGGFPLDAFPGAGKLARRTIQLPVWGGAQVASKVVRKLFSDPVDGRA